MHINHEVNGHVIMCPVCMLGTSRWLSNSIWIMTTRHISLHTGMPWVQDEMYPIRILILHWSWPHQILNYPVTRCTPIAWIDTHCLCRGRTNALSLIGFSHIKMKGLGKLRGKHLKMYCQELVNFVMGMSMAMKKCLGYVNVLRKVFHWLFKEEMA